MSQLGDLLRELADETGSGRTMMLSLLEEDRIEGGDQAMSKWRTLKQRLRFDWVGCCGGPTLRLTGSEAPIAGEDEDDDDEEENLGQNRVVDLSDSGPDPGVVAESDCLTRGTRNLAEALAEERLAREEHVTESRVVKVPLMKLLAETEGCDATTWMGSDPVCCVCMGREKGAAFIPCGHTYCRVCSREIWMNRGTCPLCNRSIFDVLDLY